MLVGLPTFHQGEISLGIAGDGPDRAILEERISELRKTSRELDVQNEIVLLGALPHEELLLHIAAADIFVLNTGYEGLSHQLIEAMQARTPIITTPVGGNSELIENGIDGILVSYNDQEGFTRAAKAIFADPKKAEAMAHHAKIKADAFTEENMLNTLIPLFQTP
jgi:glycosyltransferase involved in cell wall biosynthesis